MKLDCRLPRLHLTRSQLLQAQAVSCSRLATRRRLQAELSAYGSEFHSEASAQRAVSEALRAQRATLRSEAVELGQRLQGCVCRGDELVSENLQLRRESTELEEAEVRWRWWVRRLRGHCKSL